MVAQKPMIGRVLAGKYRLEALIGVGGMGSVYRAIQLTVSRPVAVKLLRQVSGVSQEQMAERFKREAMATSSLKHPNTVRVIDFGDEDGMLFLVLEYLEGRSLQDLIKREAPLDARRVALIGRQVARSLVEAHGLDIVHRDLKPENIWISQYDGESDFAKVMDFGIARVPTEDVSMTRTGVMIGTPKYMAPEQALAKDVGPGTDLYALGVILFEMLTGEPPFQGDSAMALALAHIKEPVPELRLPGIPEQLEGAWRGLINALMIKNPNARVQDAAQVARWLHQIEVDSMRWDEVGHNPLVANLPGRPVVTTYSGPTTSVLEKAAPFPMDELEGPALGPWAWAMAVLLMILGGLSAYLFFS